MSCCNCQELQTLRTIEWLLFQQFTPPAFTIKPISERRENDMDFLTYRANFPALPSGTDVTSQNFTVTANGEVQPTQSLGKDATSADFEVLQNANVSLALVYVDDVGNLSQAQTQDFVAVDEIAPDAPGAFGSIDLVSERHVDDAPAPAPDPLPDQPPA